MGGWDEQTFVGAAMTGTHGSGLAFGPLASQIRSITVVGADGQLTQVEPANGISDPAKFVPSRPLLEDASLPVHLVQDDATFDALAVGLGCLGVIYSVTFEAVPLYWIVERRTVTTWETLAASDGALTNLMAGAPLHGDRAAPPPDHVEIYVTPYANPGLRNRHLALLTERWRTTNRPPRAGEMVRGSPWFAPEELATYAANEADVLEPLFSTFTTAEVRGLHESGLRNMAQDYFADISYGVFTTGLINKLRVYGVEPAMPLERAKDAAALIFDLAPKLAQAGIHHSAPISMRFVAPASPQLAMSNGRKTATIEIPTLCAAPGAELMLRTYEHELIGRCDARPHWGLDRNALSTEKQVARLYPKWKDWRAVHDRLNAQGTFDGRISARLGIAR
jgi:FAD/FMN-containing dehydrogenase